MKYVINANGKKNAYFIKTYNKGCAKLNLIMKGLF